MGIPIRDSRHLHGPVDLTTPEQVRQAWSVWEAHRAQLGRFPVRDAVVLEAALERVAAYVNDNRWLADCPFCNGGIACWVQMSDSCCFDCGRVYQVDYPSEQEFKDAVASLERRPFRARFWKPWEQSAQDLRFENIEHGFPIPGAADPEPEIVIEWIKPAEADLVWGKREVIS